MLVFPRELVQESGLATDIAATVFVATGIASKQRALFANCHAFIYLALIACRHSANGVGD
jgi:hypothetical protein